jgi:hypothetical protein
VTFGRSERRRWRRCSCPAPSRRPTTACRRGATTTSRHQLAPSPGSALSRRVTAWVPITLELRSGSGAEPSCVGGGSRWCCSAYWPAWRPVWPWQRSTAPDARRAPTTGCAADSSERTRCSSRARSDSPTPTSASWTRSLRSRRGPVSPVRRARSTRCRAATPRRSWRWDRGGSTPSSGPRCWLGGYRTLAATTKPASRGRVQAGRGVGRRARLDPHVAQPLSGRE